MKKFFALVLAVAMIMSMAAVSMAANVGELAVGPFDYDADTNKLRAPKGELQYGDTAYFLLTEDGTASGAMTAYKQVEKLKVKVSYEMGEDAVEGVSVLKKKVDDDATGLGLASDYYYFIGVKLAKSTSVGDTDVIGTFELKRKEVEEDNVVLFEEIDDVEVDFEINVVINKSWLNNSGTNGYLINDDKAGLKWDTDYALKFDYDDEVELAFGPSTSSDAKGGDNEGTFTVDVSGQGKLYLRYDTKLNDAIAEANPGVKIFALNFNGVKFNRVGEFAYELEDGVAAYKVVNGALVEIPGCEYDESDETFYFNTRVLENYVFATAELVNPVVEAPVVEAPVAAPSNPSTGA